MIKNHWVQMVAVLLVIIGLFQDLIANVEGAHQLITTPHLIGRVIQKQQRVIGAVNITLKVLRTMNKAIFKSLVGIEPESEYMFHPSRKFRLDFAYPRYKVAIEIEGAVWKRGGGRHNRGSGFIKDIEKYNLLAELDWLLLRYQPNKVDYQQIKSTLKIRLQDDYEHLF